jgi:hypothetical protein
MVRKYKDCHQSKRRQETYCGATSRFDIHRRFRRLFGVTFLLDRSGLQTSILIERRCHPTCPEANHILILVQLSRMQLGEMGELCVLRQ